MFGDDYRYVRDLLKIADSRGMNTLTIYTQLINQFYLLLYYLFFLLDTIDIFRQKSLPLPSNDLRGKLISTKRINVFSSRKRSTYVHIETCKPHAA